MKHATPQQQTEELQQLLDRYAKRHGLTLTGHVRVGSRLLWAHYEDDPRSTMLLGGFLSQLMKAVKNEPDSERSAGSDSG